MERVHSRMLGGALALAMIAHLGSARAAGTEINAAAATRVALKRVPGTVKEVARNRVRGRPVFEVEVRDRHGVRYQVLIDAHTGSLLKVRPSRT
jgi:uncharacterized membrane protein YkoI